MSYPIFSGSFFEMGFQQGKFYQKNIQAAIQLPLGRDSHSSAKLQDSDKSYLQNCFEVIKAYLPHIADELRGMAKGANLSLEEVLLLHYKRELGRLSLDSLNECTTFWVPTEQGLLLAQNIDLAAQLQPFMRFCISQPASTNTPISAHLGPAGLIGYAGMNEAGLSVCINFVLSDDWQPKISPYILVRHLLLQDSIENGLSELERLPRSSSRCLTLAQHQKVRCVEMTATQTKVIDDTHNAHSNHFLHPELMSFDRMNIFSRNGSKLRLENCLEHTQKLHANACKLQQAADLLSTHDLHPIGLCAHSKTAEKTVGMIAMNTATASLLFTIGNPCQAPRQKFHFQEMDSALCVNR